MIELRSIGMYLLLAYTAYNMINILYLFDDHSTLFIVIGMAVLYLVVRVVRFLGKSGGFAQTELVGGALVLLLLLVVLMQNIFHSPFVSTDGIEIVSYVTTLAIISLLWFFIGGACGNFNLAPSNVIAVAVAAAVALSMYFATDENLTIPFLKIKEESGVESVNHLILEKHVIILLVFSYAMSTTLRYLCVALALCALFFMGGRTSLFVFLIVSILLAFRGNLLVNIAAISLVAIAGVVLFYYGIQTGNIDADAKAIREILFLDGIEEDASFQGRVELYKQSIPLLSDQLWIGKYSVTVEVSKRFFGYIHNLLSAWQFFGVFVFLGIIACLVYCARRMVFALSHRGDPADLFGAFMLIYVIISVITSKYAAWHLLWFIMGFWLLRAPVQKKTRRRRRSTSNRRRPTGDFIAPAG